MPGGATIPSLLLLYAAVFAAAALQSTAGFAYGLVLLPLLLTAGYRLPEIATIGLLTSLVQRAVVLRRLHGSVDWKQLRPMMATGVLALPVGVLVMYRVDSLAAPTTRHLVGAVIVALVMVQWCRRCEPREQVHQGWGHLAAVCSGVLQGFGSIGGPPIMLWVLAHRWPGEKIRVTLIAYSIAYVVPQLLLLSLVFGRTVLQAAGGALVALPAVAAGSLLGLVVGNRLSTPKVVLLVRVLLLAMAAGLLR